MNAQTRRLAAEQAASPADAAYAGSTFAEVRDALFAGPRYYDVWGGPGRPPLPVHPLRLRDLLRGALCRGHYPFARAAERTVDSRADLRWGPDGKGVRRLLHARKRKRQHVPVRVPHSQQRRHAPRSRSLIRVVQAAPHARGDPRAKRAHPNG